MPAAGGKGATARRWAALPIVLGMSGSTANYPAPVRAPAWVVRVANTEAARTAVVSRAAAWAQAEAVQVRAEAVWAQVAWVPGVAALGFRQAR